MEIYPATILMTLNFLISLYHHFSTPLIVSHSRSADWSEHTKTSLTKLIRISSILTLTKMREKSLQSLNHTPPTQPFYSITNNGSATKKKKKKLIDRL